MKNSAGKMVGCLAAMAILLHMVCKICTFDGKAMAQQYREEYRQQGRNQVRAEAMRAGVAVLVEGDFSWKTNELEVIEREMHKEIHDLFMKELTRRKHAKEKDSKEGNEVEVEEEGSNQGEEEGSSSREQE